MNIVYYVLIYLVGYVLSYLFIRHDFKRDNLPWTLGQRVFALILSCLSWVIVLAGVLIVYPIGWCIRSNKPVKW